MKKIRTLKVTKSHLLLLQSFEIIWDEHSWGCPTISPEHPFGSKEFYKSVGRILSIDIPDEDTDFERFSRVTDNIDKGYKELGDCLRILTQNLKIESGTYNLYEGGLWVKDNVDG